MTETNEIFESELTASEQSNIVAQPGDPMAYAALQIQETLANRKTIESPKSITIAGRKDWMGKAACKDMIGDEIFYPSPGAEAKEVRLRREAQAKAICAQCNVANECLDFAVSTRQSDGIWGGTTPEERRNLISRRSH
jgi:WhiB family redox-sensing transcriptional regulator